MKNILILLMLLTTPVLSQTNAAVSIGAKLGFHSGAMVSVLYQSKKAPIRYGITGGGFVEQSKKFWNVGSEVQLILQKSENWSNIIYLTIGAGYYKYVSISPALETRILEDPWRAGLGIGIEQQISKSSFYWGLESVIVVTETKKVFLQGSLAAYYKFGV